MKTRYREPSLFSSEVGKLSPAEEELLPKVCGKCGECKHAVVSDIAGFVSCAFLSKWEYRAERMACRFEPVRWEAMMKKTGT